MIDNAFLAFDGKNTGLVFDDSKHKEYPIRYWNLLDHEMFPLREGRSYYGFVQRGSVNIYCEDFTFAGTAGQSFSVSSEGNLVSLGQVIVIEVLHTRGKYKESRYRAENRFVGPLEAEGRLKYIDGCTDSLLISPPKMGDPCLNHLHFPTGIDQTAHTHPSHRIGIVHRGHGTCVTPFGDVDLTPGLVFVIREWNGKRKAKGLDGKRHPAGTHKFKTGSDTLDVVAFHPDSDYGPTDHTHPMINRTIVEGKSAKHFEDIRTK